MNESEHSWPSPIPNSTDLLLREILAVLKQQTLLFAAHAEFQAAQQEFQQQVALTLVKQEEQAVEQAAIQSGVQSSVKTEMLDQWKKANPVLSRKCSVAANKLGASYSGLIEALIDEINEAGKSHDDYADEFTLRELIDKYGLRLTHLGTMVQVLTQLGN